MIKIRLPWKQINGIKLESEMKEKGLVVQYAMPSDTLEGYIDVFQFGDVEEVITQAEDGEPITTYKKLTKEIVVIDEESKEVDKWVDYTQETLDLIADIKEVVAVHDPTPVVETAKLQDDKMIELILKATTLEELQLELLAERYGIQ